MAKIKVAIQGERGAFSEVAAHQFLSDKIEIVPCDSFEKLFERTEVGKTKYGVIPIENSLVGSIHRNYELLLEHKLNVIGETYLRIIHCLVAPPKVSLKKVSKVYSHPVALDQCRKFFKKNATIAPISYYDTAGAVKMISESGSLNSAAIAGPYTAQLYDMKILKKSIEDEKSNYTRFLLLGKKSNLKSKKIKTSIVFSMKNQPGGLFKALSVFALRDIDLTKIESRPVRKKAWQYYFYVDFEGSVKEQRIKYALDHLGEIASFIKVLGSYPVLNGRGNYSL